MIVGLLPRWSYLDVGPDRVRVRMSWGFLADIPRESIRSARRVPNTPLSVGVHGWRGRWIVNGAAGPMVEITVDPPSRAWFLGLHWRLRELLVSVEHPDTLIVLLKAR